MLNLLLNCTYCGKDWERYVYAMSAIENEKCSKCGDRNFTVRDNSKSKIDYYQGSPPFEIKKDKDWTWGNGGSD
jgi:transcription elongation factor Elf1